MGVTNTGQQQQPFNPSGGMPPPAAQAGVQAPNLGGLGGLGRMAQPLPGGPQAAPMAPSQPYGAAGAPMVPRVPMGAPPMGQPNQLPLARAPMAPQGGPAMLPQYQLAHALLRGGTR